MTRALLAALPLAAAWLLASCTGPTCASAICGCWEQETAQVNFTVVDIDGDPIEGIDMICINESVALATSDAAGLIATSFETRVSPGCGPERCNRLTLSDPTGACDGTDSTLQVLNGSTVTLDCDVVGDDDDSARE